VEANHQNHQVNPNKEQQVTYHGEQQNELKTMNDPRKSTGVISLPQPKKIQISFPSLVIHLIMIILAGLVVVPLILPFMFVFKTQMQFNYHPWSLPTEFHWENFKVAWDSVQIGQGMINTFMVCIGAVVATVPLAAMAGYIFARYRSKVTNVLFYFIMAGFFIPTQMVLIPVYKLEISLGLVNTLHGLFFLMAAFGIPFWTMIFRSFFSTLPGEMVEAARIDGAGHFGTFIKIMFPLAKPATVMAILLVFMGAWSDYLLSLIFINSQNLFTLQLRVAQFVGNLGANYFPQYAAGVIISAAPTIILYIVFHKKIIEGTTLAGALKG
jgi:ABC-type glycerol-3-phosphate transport system permease component